MPTIGLRELKNRASEVVRGVRDEGAVYVITVNGVPSAVVKAVETGDIDDQRREATEAWIARAETIADQFAEVRTDARDAATLVAEQRR